MQAQAVLVQSAMGALRQQQNLQASTSGQSTAAQQADARGPQQLHNGSEVTKLSSGSELAQLRDDYGARLAAAADKAEQVSITSRSNVHED